MPPDTKKNLIFCVHAHQPVGNFDSVFEQAYEKSYRPFFEVLEKHPSIVVACHISGSLLDWLESHKPEWVAALKTLAARGQIEFVGGAYYEPIYGVIPRKDLVGQIGLMRAKLKELFGQSPKGVWLTERVWDPDLVSPLKEAGVGFTILDDFHFEKAGKKGPIVGYYQSRHGKDKIDLFASMKQLRYLMPFRKPEETIEFLRSTPATNGDVFLFGDDLEKFGLWPGTFDWVYKEGWLDQFFSLVEKSSNIRLSGFAQIRSDCKPKGMIQIPHASYSEMMDWSGGRFYNFFEKYSESCYMRDRMWHVSQALEKMPSTNGSRANQASARRFLYRAQCNCSYWHGVFGGLYLHHLRSAVFENLIQAETLLAPAGVLAQREILGSGERWRLRQKRIVSFFDASYGAALEELDFVPKSVNLMCNLKRLREPYHESVLHKKPVTVSTGKDEPLSIHQILGVKEKDLDKHLFYDQFKRLSFMDHVFSREIMPEEFARSSYREAGDFVGTKFAAKRVGGAKDPSLRFERKGAVMVSRKKKPLVLTKQFFAEAEASVRAHFSFHNPGTTHLEFVWGQEFNFSIGDSYASKGVDERGVREWVFHDGWRNLKIRMSSDEAFYFIAVPIETVSESESGLERTFQELGVLLQRTLRLRPKETKEYALTLEVIDE